MINLHKENNFLVESLAAYQDAESKLAMYFTVNTAWCQLPWKFKISIFFNLDYSWPDITNFSTIFWSWYSPTESTKNIEGLCSPVLE